MILRLCLTLCNWRLLRIGGNLLCRHCHWLRGGLSGTLTIRLYLIGASFGDNVSLSVGGGVLASLEVEGDNHHLTNLKAVEVAALVAHERKLGSVLPVCYRLACVRVETTDVDYEVALLKSVTILCHEALHWAD